MKRRRFLGAVAAVGSAAIAGCSETDKADSGVEGGAMLDYDESVNTVDGETVIDLHLRGWYNCSGASSPSEVTYTVEVIVAGETEGQKEWTVEFDDCMVEHTKHMTFTIPREVDDVLVRVTS